MTGPVTTGPVATVPRAASLGRRLAAFVLDSLAASLVAGLFVAVVAQGNHRDAAHRLPGYWSLIPFALDYVLGILLAGRSLGMAALGLRVIRVDRVAAIGPGRALTRTVLLMLLIPAVVIDREGRGLHDRFTDTAVIRA